MHGYAMKSLIPESYLLSGMCSNGPLVGIVPHKLLFETSLQEHRNISTCFAPCNLKCADMKEALTGLSV